MGFTVDRECELKARTKKKPWCAMPATRSTSRKCRRIAAGKLPTKLALTWDDRVSFMLTEGLQLKKIAFLDTVFEGSKADDGGFDTDVAIATGELSKLLPDLIEALGGEADSGMATAAAAVAGSSTSTVTGPATALWTPIRIRRRFEPAIWEKPAGRFFQERPKSPSGQRPSSAQQSPRR